MDSSSGSRDGRGHHRPHLRAGSQAGGSNSSSTNTAAASVSGVSSQQVAAAANSLQLLLNDDPSLRELVQQASLHGGDGTQGNNNFGSTTTSTTATGSSGDNDDGTDHVAYAYAAKLLQEDAPTSSTSAHRGGPSTSSSTKERADRALQDVGRKLALVESLAVKLSRTRPEAVAGHLLQLHGYDDPTSAVRADDDEEPNDDEYEPSSGGTATGGTGTDADAVALPSAGVPRLTLAQIRDRADRLERQAHILDNVAQRVETSVARGAHKLESTCTRLERVLETSSTLKSLLKLTFESQKLLGYDTDDVRDLVRAAASTAVVEELLRILPPGIVAVERMRPQLRQAGILVRHAAAQLLQQQWRQTDGGTDDPTTLPTHVGSLSQLGAVLQVYYSLGELSEAVWKSVEQAHQQAEQVTRQLLQTTTTTAGSSSSGGGGGGGGSARDKRKRQVRTEAAQAWAQHMADVCLQVWNLQRVLAGKSDPTTRQWFAQVVQDSPVPPTYAKYLPRANSKGGNSPKGAPSIWTLFWNRYCGCLADWLASTIPASDHGAAREDVAALYPALRAAAMELVSRLQETPAWDETIAGSAGSASNPLGSIGGGSGPYAPGNGIGTLGGGQLDDPFLEWNTRSQSNRPLDEDNPQAAGNNASRSPRHAAHASTPADVWTQPNHRTTNQRNSWLGVVAATPASVSTSAVLLSTEWKTLDAVGMLPLQQAFVKACQKRLYEPLQYMFPEQTVTLDDDGVGVSAAAAAGMTLLPSKYDIQRFDENIRQELSLADPRKEGGGDLTLVGLVAECVCDMIAQFCDRARTAVSSLSDGVESNLLQSDWNMSEAMQHDRKVAAIMHATAKYLKVAGEKTFVAPYRPAVYPQHEEAARICQAGLDPALLEIEKMVKHSILYPLCRAINRRILGVLAKMHHGVYIDSEDAAPSFVQKHLTDVLERVGQNLLARFPPEYASLMAARVATFTIYAFVSNAALLRPLGENARLHVTQDLADLELALEQLVVKNGSAQALALVVGHAYAELRAVRQMLFWTGLENSNASAQDLSKALLREVWMKDVRPSTVLHYLYSFAPSLLSSPHHAKRLKAEDFVATLVKLDGSVNDGEDAAWMTTMGCCDSYQQRTSSVTVNDGDARIPQTLILLGQELIRRRQPVANLN